MQFQNNFKKITLLAFALVVMSFAVNYAHAYRTSTPEYTFKVVNKTGSKIVKLLASEDGKTYGEFDVGSGVAPGQTVTFVWDKSTDNGNCEQWIKAKFADGSASPAAKHDFCEANLVLEFGEE
jgi:hypothetical protein